MTDYWTREVSYVSMAPKVGWFITGDTSVVAYSGVRCYTSDMTDEVVVMLATTKQGWGMALETVATAGKAVSVLLFGIIKVTLGGTGTRDLALAFDSAGLLVVLADQAVNESAANSYTIYYGAKVARALRSGTTGDKILVLFNP
jgi:hypothetical protein